MRIYIRTGQCQYSYTLCMYINKAATLAIIKTTWLTMACFFLLNASVRIGSIEKCGKH